MTAILLALMALMAGVAAALVWMPWKTAPKADDPRRASIEAQKEKIFSRLLALPENAPEEEQLRLERVASRILRRLDDLPPAPLDEAKATASKKAAARATLAVLLIAGPATWFVVPAVQKAVMPAAEAERVSEAARLPRLRAEATRKRSTAAYNAWGAAAFGGGNYGEASRAYAESLKLDAKQPEPLRRLGTMLLNREGFGEAPLEAAEAQQAFSLVRTAALLAPDDHESQLLLGYALLKFGLEKEALEALERYRSLHPQGREADEIIATLRSEQNDASPALKLYAAHCASCHGPAGGGALAGELRDLTQTPALLAQIIREGQGGMPAFPDLGDEEVGHLVGLLKEWR